MGDYNRLILFDCDGTLVDGQHLIFDAMAATFERHGLGEVTREAVRGVIGLSLPDAMAKLRPEDTGDFHHELSEGYKATFHELHVAGQLKAEPLYPGTAEMLHELDRMGYLLGVATGKSMRGLKRVLAHHDLADLFVTLPTADNHPSKPHPSMVETAMAEAGAAPATTIMIGDTSYDMLMGKAAGCHTVGVDWGYHDQAELKQTGAGYMLTAWTELAALANRIFEGKA